MFFMFPINTDAPIYHWPYGTVGLILLNTLIFLCLPHPDAFILMHGEGLTPLQWVSSNFIHGDIMHLVGNMVFLWAFGLLVEGKLGTPLFLTVYLLIGVVQCALEQILMNMLGQVGGSYGASSIVYGLLAISLLWAPRNEFTIFYCFFLLRLFASTFELSVLWFAAFYIGWELMVAWLINFQMSTPTLHLMGAGVGAVVGYLFLHQNWVDCEGWDLLSLVRKRLNREAKSLRTLLPQETYALTGTKGKVRRPTGTSDENATPEEDEDALLKRRTRSEKRLQKIRQALLDNKPTLALSEYENATRKYQEFSFLMRDRDCLSLADGLYRLKMYDRALSFYEMGLQRATQPYPAARLRLAAMYVELHQRPRAALRQLKPLDSLEADELSDKQRKRQALIIRQAEKLIEEGVLEYQQPEFE